MLNLILCLVSVGIIAINILVCLGRGVHKSRVRALMIVGCAVGAVALTVVSRSAVVSETVMANNIIPFLNTLPNMSVAVEMLNISATLREILANIITSLTTPIICVLLFLVLSFFTWIVYLVLGIKKKSTTLGGLRALGWGALQGIVCVAVVMIPIASYTEYVPAIGTTVLESGILPTEQQEPVQEALKEVEAANKGVLVVYRALGGQQVCNALGNFKVNGHTVAMTEEINSITSLGIQAYRIGKTPVAEYGSTEVLAMHAIADSFEDSVLLPTIAGEIIYDATQKWLNDQPFFGIAKPSFGEMNDAFDPLFTSLLTILNTDARDTEALQADFSTVADMIATLAENGIFADFSNTDALLEKLSAKGVVTQLIYSLGENQSMKVLIPEINKLGMRIIATTLGVPENADVIYNSFIDDVVVALNEIRTLEGEQARIETLSSKLDQAFDEAGIVVDPALLDCYSASMITDLLKGTDPITMQDVQDFFTILNLSMVGEPAPEQPDEPLTDEIVYRESFALAESQTSNTTLSGNAYADMTDEQLQKSGAATLASALKKLAEAQTVGEETGVVLVTVYAELLVEAPETLEKLASVQLTVAVSEETIEVSASLSSAETVKNITKKVTLEDLLIDSEAAAETITEETIQKEADAISAIFDAANELKTQLGQGSEMKLEDVAGAVGNILDSLGQTETFGSDKTADLFTAVLQSETVREAAGLDMKTATDMANSVTDSSKGEVSYTQTLTVVTGSISVVTKLGQNGETVTEEELIELIRNLNPQTAGMIEVYVTPARMESYNVPAQYATTTAQLISSLFHYMANETLSDYDAEAKALNQILSVALSAKDHSDADSLYTKDGVEGVLPGTAYETVSTFLGSDAITYALRSTLLDENGKVIEDRRDAFGWGESMNTESEVYKETVDAIKTYYQEHKDEETKSDLIAFAALLGVDAETAGVFN